MIASMTKENVDLVRRAFEGPFTEGTFTRVLDSYHPDLVYHPRSDEPDSSARVGRDEFERLLRSFLEAFSVVTFDVLELIDAGDYVIASTILNGTGSASGADVSDPYVFVYKMRDGLVVEAWEYRTTGEAFESIGYERPVEQRQPS